MDCVKDIIEIAQTFASFLAICFGGWWTYQRFVWHRLSWPHANVELALDDSVLPEGKRLVHAEFKIVNTGSVIIKPEYAELRIRGMVPIPEDTAADVKAGKDPVIEGKSEMEWPLVSEREWTWNSGDFEIEPGETDSLNADFFIGEDVSVCQFYAFLENPKKRQDQKKRQDPRTDPKEEQPRLGWTLTKVHTFNQGGETNDRKQR